MDFNDFLKRTKDSYLGYSVMTLSSRALPYVQDGFKPVHRRVLYAMHSLGMTYKAQPKKSARIVGDVIGKYHPHGDSSIYGAMVLMSQPWKMRYPLVDGQGNFGSRDGDGAAAMRYTEARPTALADAIMAELNLGSIDYVNNYDGTLTEPEFLPAPLPVLLLNGSEGIAVGMTCDIPSHNAQEVLDATIATIRNPKISVEEVMGLLKGPDLPTGGQIITPVKDIIKAYASGDGRIRVRARWEVEKKAKKQWEIVITELPSDMCAAKILLRVSEAETYDPSKDKSPNQKLINLKNFVRNSIANIYDATAPEDGANAAKIVIEPKSTRQTPEDFMDQVITMLDLESTVSLKFNAVSLDRLPRSRSIKDLISDWVEFRKESVKKRSLVRISKIERRLEILDGRLTVMDDLDELIRIIREEDEPKQEIMAHFGLTELQADDVLEIKLRELRRLEVSKLVKEHETLSKELKALNDLINSETKMRNVLIKEAQSATALIADDRRTLIEEAGAIEVKEVSKAAPEPVTIFVTRDGWWTGRKGHDIDYPETVLKPDDEFTQKIETRLDKTIIILSQTGRSYSFAVESVPFGRNSIHINTLIQFSNEKVSSIIEYNEGEKYFLSQTAGRGFVISLDSLLSRNKNGKDIFKLNGEDINLCEPYSPNSYLNITTTDDRFIQIPSDEFEGYEYPKGQGVRMLSLSSKTNEKVKSIIISDGDMVTDKGVVELDLKLYRKKRATTPRRI